MMIVLVSQIGVILTNYQGEHSIIYNMSFAFSLLIKIIKRLAI